uniref:Uncharacterized protein n=1 Tax=Wuchereria bancrofti TaxID=6293 RepID=A0AAF5RTR3_WUCBA
MKRKGKGERERERQERRKQKSKHGKVLVTLLENCWSDELTKRPRAITINKFIILAAYCAFVELLRPN